MTDMSIYFCYQIFKYIICLINNTALLCLYVHHKFPFILDIQINLMWKKFKLYQETGKNFEMNRHQTIISNEVLLNKILNLQM